MTTAATLYIANAPANAASIANVGNSYALAIGAGGMSVGGNILASGNITANNISGTILGNIITTSATLSGSLTANTVQANLSVNTASYTGTTVSVSGTITGGNISAVGNIYGTVVGTISTASATLSGTLTANTVQANLSVNTVSFTGTTVSVSGSITGANLSAGTGNLTGGNLSVSGNIFGNVQGNVSTSSISVSGNVIANNVIASQHVGQSVSLTQLTTPSGTPNLTGNAAGGTLTAGTYYFKIVAADGSGGTTLPGPEASVATTGNTSSILISWTPVTSAAFYQVWYGTATGVENRYYSVSSNTYTLTANAGTSGTIPVINSTGAISTVGNITGGNIIGTIVGTISTTSATLSGSLTANTVQANLSVNTASYTGTIVSVTGNITAGGGTFGNGNVSTTGNIAAGYFVGNGAALTGISAAGGVANSLSNGTSSFNIATANGNANITIGGTSNISVFANTGVYVTGLVSASGNILTGAQVTAVGNLNAAGLVTSGSGGSISGTGSITGAGLFSTTTLSAAGNITGASVLGGVMTGTSLSVTGAVTGANLFFGSGNVSGTGNILGGNILATTRANAASFTGGLVSVSGTVTGASVVGGVMTGTSLSVSGNITTSSTIIAAIAGTVLSATGNSPGMELGNVSAVNTPYIDFHSSGNASADYDFRVVASGGGAAGTGILSLVGASVVSTGTFTVNSGNAATAIINGAGNTNGNIGSTSAYFKQIFAQASTALYADLAEVYEADADYAPGTVVAFGGSQEVTISTTDSSRRVAGVISANPSYLMNNGLTADHRAIVALTGRVPTSVVGAVAKGDMMVSAGNGRARAEDAPVLGSIIGKALEDFNGTEGVIEIVVGRL